MLSNWKISRKIAAAFALVLAVVFGVGGIAVVALTRISAVDVRLRTEWDQDIAVGQARFYLTRAENSLRGLLVTQDPYYAERLTAHMGNLKKQIEAIKQLKADDPAQVEAAEQIAVAAAAWNDQIAVPTLKDVQTGNRDAAAALVGQGSLGDKLMSAVEDKVDALSTLSDATTEKARSDFSAVVSIAIMSMIAGLIIAVSLAAAFGLLLTRAIATPLVSLTRVMDSLAGGDLSVEVGNRDRKDEIGAMSQSVQVFKEQAVALKSTSAAVDDAKAMLVGADRAMGIIEFDLAGNILTANENFLRVLGYSLSDIKGRHHQMLCDRDYAASAQYAEFWRRLNAGEVIADKFTRYGRGGAKAVIEASYNPILGPDGKPYKVVKFATDITAAELEREQRAQRDAATAREQSDIVNETAAGLSALAAGDLAHRITTAFPGEYARLQTDFNAAMSKLEEAMGVIGANASTMQSGAGEISQAADDLSRRTEQQAATLEETAAALDEITATVKRTAEGAERAGTVVVGAKAAAEQSGLVVGRAVAAMGEIERSSDQISQIIGVIDEIAFQTNLLALNAGVEAARAGDAGRGFAVVASEVRALAQRSAEAAKEIKTLIAASSGHVKDGVGLVGETGQALTAIVERVSEINGLMAEITASAHEQATALSEVNTAVNQMDQTTQQNAAMVEQSTAASHNLSQEAEELAVLVGKFHVSEDGRGSSRTGRTKPNPVRQAQTRIADFARQSAPAPVRRSAAGGGTALAQSSEPQWEQF